ncbi:Crp/Fnr family transcriptional regulator [uncultured Olegusella sp.]|uniref:Crp/Fnr family transcriptional regulator n=1 Tax=uncultured Olegusella sp. TaxID=1979846 RepID=UPI002639B961|nr:Crp/Fnr family transcriptional regulator [uncultured Olegusella sp.]
MAENDYENTSRSPQETTVSPAVSSNVNPTVSPKDADHTFVSSIPLFAGLSDDAKESLISGAIHSLRPKGSILVHEGDPINSIIIVRSGRIKTFRTDSNGQEYVLDVLHDGQAIWRGVFMEEQTYHYSVGCLTDVDLYIIRRSHFETLIKNNPKVAIGLIHMIGAELFEAEEKIMMLGIRDPQRRLAEYLLYRDERCVGPEIRLKLQDIASSVGLRPETVSRTLSAFERRGMLRRVGQGRLLLLDRSALHDVAVGSN